MERPVAILAGGGGLPLALAAELRGQGRVVLLLALRGFADRGTRRAADAQCGLLDARAVLETLRRWNPATVTLAGYVNRPGPLALLSAGAAFRNRDIIARMAASGDDGLLRGVVGLLEEQGFSVSGIHDLAPKLLAQAGLIGQTPITQAESIEMGMRLLGSLSPFDVGQAAVISGARICAVEGPEGTDAMIARVGKLWGGGRLPRSRHAPILVKTAKIGQDLRIDMPAIGPRTIHRAAAAGFCGIAIGAGQTLILDQAETIAAANRRGIFLAGVNVDAVAGAGRLACPDDAWPPEA